MASPTDPIEQLITGIIRRERLANTLSAEALEEIRRLFDDYVAEIRRIDPMGPSRQRDRMIRQEKLLRALEKRTRKFSPEMERRLRDILAPIGREEALRTQADLVATLGEVGERVVRTTPITQARIRTILNTEPFQGRVLREHTQRLAASAYDRARTAIRQGMIAEESIPDIVRRVRGRQAGFIRQDAQGRFVAQGTRAAKVRPRFVGGAMATTTRDAEALVRTAVTHVSAMGQLETYRENERVVKSVRYVATLDDRTTEICFMLDGEEWLADSSEVVVPGRDTHYQCRSTLVPVVDWERLGLDPPPEGDRLARDMSTVPDEELDKSVSSRRSRSPRARTLGEVTRVSSGTRAEQWLMEQRPEVQARVLGKRKAELFRRGEISLRDIVRDDFTIVPLRELGLG